MEYTPVFYDKDNLHTYIEHNNLANGYCLHCNRPLNRTKDVYCTKCNRYKVLNGLEYRVKFGSVGREVIPYQMCLNRRMFNDRISSTYRGLKKDRLYFDLDTNQIDLAVIKLIAVLSSNRYKHNYTYHTLKNQVFVDRFKTLSSNIKTFPKRLLYHILLWFISRYINKSTLFKSDIHFSQSMIMFIFIHINRTIVRTTNIRPPSKMDKSRLPLKYYLHLYKNLTTITKPLIASIVGSVEQRYKP